MRNEKRVEAEKEEQKGGREKGKMTRRLKTVPTLEICSARNSSETLVECACPGAEVFEDMPKKVLVYSRAQDEGKGRVVRGREKNSKEEEKEEWEMGVRTSHGGKRKG